MKSYLTGALAIFAQFSLLSAQDISLSKILVDSEGWTEVANGWPGVTFLHAAPDGSIAIFLGELGGQINVDGTIGKAGNAARSSVNSNTLVRGPHGVYSIAAAGKSVQVRLHDKDAVLDWSGLKAPSCLTLWPDAGHLVIGEKSGAWLWAVRIEPDGSFGPGDRYYSLRTQPGKALPVTSMTMDAGYLLYACTPLGVQVFDPTGRLSGVILAPAKEPMTAIAIGGPEANALFVAAGDKIYKRKIQGKASYTLKKQ